MELLWAVVILCLNAVWLVGVVFGLPGTWLMVATAAGYFVYQAAAHVSPTMFHPITLVAVVLLATAGEVAEFFAGVAGSRATGGTQSGALGALVGGIIGAVIGTFAIPVPVIGSLLGACGGAAIGAVVMEMRGGQGWSVSLKSGAGAGAGLLVGRLVKICAAVAIWIVLTVASFWP
jgi:uncharacterized protein YqgC (DUF456 family)